MTVEDMMDNKQEWTKVIRSEESFFKLNLKDILDYLSSKFEYILMDIPADFGNNSFLNLVI